MEEPGEEQADVLLDPKFDPGGGAMGTMGADGSVETNWFVLLHRRVTDRAVRSPRYQWWALVALLAGLLSLNITFTVFVVALPTVKAEFNTNFSVLAWASTGPLLAFGVAAPCTPSRARAKSSMPTSGAVAVRIALTMAPSSPNW